jgi:hypothetical protein
MIGTMIMRKSERAISSAVDGTRSALISLYYTIVAAPVDKLS